MRTRVSVPPSRLVSETFCPLLRLTLIASPASFRLSLVSLMAAGGRPAASRLLGPGGPVHAPAVSAIEVGLIAVDIADLAVNRPVTLARGEQRDGAHARPRPWLIQLHRDLRSADREERRHAVGG